MKRNLHDLREFKIETSDQITAHIKDFLFDEKTWTIRYVEADFGQVFSTKRVLIPRVFLKKPLWEEKRFPIEISFSDIGKCPEVTEHETVSRQYEEKLYEYYDLKPYWYSAYNVPVAAANFPIRSFSAPEKTVDEEDLDTILRSYNELVGYHIQAIDGKIGHVEDLLIDDENWQVTYAVIDTSNWLPWSKNVLIGIAHLNKISYIKRLLNIKLLVDAIKEAPEYDPADILNEQTEKENFDYFSRSLVK